MDHQISQRVSRPKAVYILVAAFFGVIEAVVFGVIRYTTLAGHSQRILGQIALYGMFVVVGICATYAAFRGETAATALVLSIGPVAGLFLYLLGYHLVYPPSTDSPTCFIFLIVAVTFVGTGLAGYRVGHQFRPT